MNVVLVKERFFVILFEIVLIVNSLLVFLPLTVMMLSSFKSTREIFSNPFGLPQKFSLDNFLQVWNIAHFNLYFRNSLLVSLSSILLILFLSSSAAFALGRYRFKGSVFLYLYFLSGIMLPIRLGIIPLFLLMKNLGLLDTYYSLIFTYTAAGLPSAVFILAGFFRTLPSDLENAARIDGCNEFQIYWRIMLPLMRPALAIVTIYNFVPIWNDFFFPLVFIQSDNLKTIPLGMTIFFGQYQTNWALLFAGLTLAAAPLVLLYLFISKQFIKGLTAGAIK